MVTIISKPLSKLLIYNKSFNIVDLGVPRSSRGVGTKKAFVFHKDSRRSGGCFGFWRPMSDAVRDGRRAAAQNHKEKSAGRSPRSSNREVRLNPSAGVVD